MENIIMEKKMGIWIDLANSPHVPFFEPIIKKLKSDYNIIITLRDFSQTVQLANDKNMTGPVIGSHGGKSKLGKIKNIISRSFSLRRYAREKSIQIAVSHNSYTQLIAAKMLGIKAVTLMDYEGQKANHLAFRLADKIIVPMHFPDSYLRKYGANFHNVYKYNGFKEQLYLTDFIPNQKFPSELNQACSLPENWNIKNNYLITVRPPAYMALYHQFKNPLFDYLLKKLSVNKQLTVIMLPRTIAQKRELQIDYPMFYYPRNALDGNNLIFYSDLVISAGGTMNREAAIMGTPVYTIFAGELPAVDNELITMKRLIKIENEDFINQMSFTKTDKKPILKNENLLSDIIDNILHD